MKVSLSLLVICVLVSACDRGTNDAVIAALVDRQAIDQLVEGDYPRALDGRDWDAYAGTYTEDGELSLGGQTAKGRAEIKKFVAALPNDNPVIHVISNLSYKLAGDTAAGGAYWQDIGLVNGAPGVVVAGHYDDTLRKVDGRWLFSKRAIVIDYAAPAPATPGGTSSE